MSITDWTDFDKDEDGPLALNDEAREGIALLALNGASPGGVTAKEVGAFLEDALHAFAGYTMWNAILSTAKNPSFKCAITRDKKGEVVFEIKRR